MPEVRTVDVAVIGAGLAGTSTARVLTRAGYAVALIDPQPTYPHEFRAEKLGVPQMEQFDRLGLGASARAVATPVDEICVVRFGTLVERERRREYGLAYADLINRLRADLPDGLELTPGRVAEIEAGPERSRLTLADGRRIEARLVVVATGLGEAVRHRLGIARDLISRRHSLAIGFTMRAPLAAFPFEALTYYPEAHGGRAAYLTLFPLGARMRANLFVYRDIGEDWTRAFRADPEGGLAALMPRLGRFCPDLSVDGHVETRSVDLIGAADPARDGLVLLGDAYRVACPIPGTGIGKVLTDVERLCTVHAPRWLDGPRIGRDQVAAFYADPVKALSDARSLRAGLYARAVATEEGPAWRARRVRNRAGRHAIHWLRELRAALPSRSHQTSPEKSGASS